jgi:protein-tyrosine phosphatase
MSAKLSDVASVESAGVSALVGQPIAPLMLPLLAGAGAQTDDFAARRLTRELVQRADLVLTMTKSHRGIVVDRWPAAVRHTFTLLEFARLLFPALAEGLGDGSQVTRVRASVRYASQRRCRPTVSDDVPDPYGQPPIMYEQVFEQIRSAIDTISTVVSRGSTSSSR